MTPRPSILLVEDDPELRLVFRTVLVIEGFDVCEAVDGLEAMLCVEADMPQVIVLDLGLPRVNGKGVLSQILAHPLTQGIPVVIVTGSSEPVEEVRSERILRKPVEADALVQTIRRCLTQTSPQ